MWTRTADGDKVPQKLKTYSGPEGYWDTDFTCPIIWNSIIDFSCNNNDNKTTKEMWAKQRAKGNIIYAPKSSVIPCLFWGRSFKFWKWFYSGKRQERFRRRYDNPLQHQAGKYACYLLHYTFWPAKSDGNIIKSLCKIRTNKLKLEIKQSGGEVLHRIQVKEPEKSTITTCNHGLSQTSATDE